MYVLRYVRDQWTVGVRIFPMTMVLSFLVGYSHRSLPLGGSGYMSAVNCTHIVIYQLKVNRLSKNLSKMRSKTVLIKLGLTLLFKCHAT